MANKEDAFRRITIRQLVVVGPLFILLALAWMCPTSATAQTVYEVGTSVVNITPDYPIRLNGFGNRREESNTVSQPIYAKAIAIAEPDTEGQTQTAPLVLVTIDSLGIRQSMVDEVARRLHDSHALPPQNLAVTFTHSHCTPKVNGACDNIFSQPIPEKHQRHIDRYTKELTDHITTVARNALDDTRPATLHWTVGRVTFAKNRRTAGGPIDHDLPMLVARDPKTQTPRAIYVSYACHCVTLSFNQISGDWAGYAASMIQREYPGAVALVSIGAGSDQNPISGVTNDQVQIAESQGLEIATEVKRLLSEPMKRIAGKPLAMRQSINLPLNPLPNREDLIKQTETGRPTDRYNAITQLQRLDRGDSLLSAIRYPIQTWAFGDRFCMTFLAGEVCVDYSIRLKQELDRERFWLNAYSNDFGCYIPSERLAAEGGYGGGAEVPYFALPATLKPGLEDKIVDEVLRQVPVDFHVKPGTQGISPKTPTDSLGCITTAADLQVLLVAAEPQITDPVAIDFGPDGCLWVAEMNNYGQDVYETFTHSGRIRRLRDRDGDGFFEAAETYVDGLRFPTDVKAWRDGVLICDAPDILFARDEDNDGKADTVRKLFSGFEIKNAQARVNSLRFGLDQWVYGASGLFGGSITSSITGETVDCRNRDFRIDPDKGLIEAVSGRTQQGRCRNDWGDWFGCSNGSLLRSIANDTEYTLRNPLAVPEPFQTVRIDPEALQLHPPKNLVTFELSGPPGRATAACGLGIYRDVALGEQYANDAFTCEPVHQSVHRIDFQPDDHGFRGTVGAGESTREFLSSSDRWFRPVQARTGPDGGLWIVDMYRFVIEHSRWIPQATLANLNINAGADRGRIYRVMPRMKSIGNDSIRNESIGNRQPIDIGDKFERRTSEKSITSVGQRSILPDLQAMSNEDLVAQLDSTNGPRRDLAHQMILWRDARSAATRLRQIASESKHAAARIQALAVLSGLDELTNDDLSRALRSSQPEVQRFAVKLSEPRLQDSTELLKLTCDLTASDQPRLRRQAALSLGAVEAGLAEQTLARVLSDPNETSLITSAALNSIHPNNVRPILEQLSGKASTDRNEATWKKLVLLAIRIGDQDTIDHVLTRCLPAVDPFPTGSFAGFWAESLDALDDRWTKQDWPVARQHQMRVLQLFGNAMNILNQTNETQATGTSKDTNDTQSRPREQRPETYQSAVQLLGRKFGPFCRGVLKEQQDQARMSANRRVQVLAQMVSPRFPASFQGQALRAINNTQADQSVPQLVSLYSSVNSDLRTTIVELLLGRISGQAELIRAIENEIINPGNLTALQKDKLLTNTDPAIRVAAERLFNSPSDSNRAAILQAMSGALDVPGSTERGRIVFRKHCSSCHRLESFGHEVGPDLNALTNRDPTWLLNAILDPNREVDDRYLSWTALTIDGKIHAGMIVEETSVTIRLREADGKEHEIPRNALESMRSQKSLMPEGMERDLSVQALSDLIAYLDGRVSPPKTFAGNQPQRIKCDAQGILMLTASHAAIRGKQIRFENQYANVGYWHDQNDSVSWDIEVEASGEFDIYLNASCDSESAGNHYRIEGLSQPIHGRVTGTGGWDRYRHSKIGTTDLNAGSHTITMRAASPIHHALFDLREVRLVPSGKAPGFAIEDVETTPLPRYPPEIAPFLLDESQSTERRQQVIDQRPGMGPGIVGLLVKELGKLRQGSAEAHRCQDWIGRVSLAVGMRNDGGEIRDLLEITAPNANQKLLSWQAMAIGDGLIAGISQIGVWPKQRIEEILEGIPDVKSKWPSTLQHVANQVHDPSIESESRCAILRMVALLDQKQAIEELQQYLVRDTDQALQRSGVSAMVDVDSESANLALWNALSFLRDKNRQIAIHGLNRSQARREFVRERVRGNQNTLSQAEIEGFQSQD